MVNGFYLKYLDVAHKWLDGTKTTVELVAEMAWGNDIVLTYVHTTDDIETCKSRKVFYMDILLKAIQKNCVME